METKDIFCIEGIWNSADLSRDYSLVPFLNILKRTEGIKYVHLKCVDSNGFFFLLKKFSQKKYRSYKILYLAFHGCSGCIHLSDRVITLSEIADYLENKCSDKIIIFASCDTLEIPIREARDFLCKTSAVALGGYRSEIGWIESTAFELLLFKALQSVSDFSNDKGLISKKVKNLSRRFKNLKFRFLSKISTG